MGGNVSNQVGPLSDEEAKQIKILTNFSIEEILSCYENFVKQSVDGLMDQDNFEVFWGQYMNKNCEKEYTQHVFRSFDFNNDGYVNFREFICGLSMSMRGSLDEKLTWAFNMYDQNKDGLITLDEMEESMKAVYSMNGVIEPEQLKCGVEAFHGIDKDMDGRITVAEFIKGVKKDQRLIKLIEQPLNMMSSDR